MTNLPDSLFSLLLNSDEAKRLSDIDVYQNGYSLEESWSLAEANALQIAMTLDYSYEDKKALQFFILLYEIYRFEENQAQKIGEVLTPLKAKISREGFDEIRTFIREYFLRSCELTKPTQLAVFIVRSLSYLELCSSEKQFTPFEDISEAFNGYVESITLQLLRGESPIVDMAEALEMIPSLLKE